ncbi:allograft inflammatory factor 1-like, partial [Saccoglossus kowalevskii]
EIINEDLYKDEEDLEEKLVQFKAQFMEYDNDHSGDLGLMDVQLMMEKLGQPKNQLELKKIIAEVDLNNSGTICYREFVVMMLGKKSSILKIILMFEKKSKEAEKPKGIPAKKTFDDLP